MELQKEQALLQVWALFTNFNHFMYYLSIGDRKSVAFYWRSRRKMLWSLSVHLLRDRMHFWHLYVHYSNDNGEQNYKKRMRNSWLTYLGWLSELLLAGFPSYVCLAWSGVNIERGSKTQQQISQQCANHTGAVNLYNFYIINFFWGSFSCFSHRFSSYLLVDCSICGSWGTMQAFLIWDVEKRECLVPYSLAYLFISAHAPTHSLVLLTVMPMYRRKFVEIVRWVRNELQSFNIQISFF